MLRKYIVFHWLLKMRRKKNEIKVQVIRQINTVSESKIKHKMEKLTNNRTLDDF